MISRGLLAGAVVVLLGTTPAWALEWLQAEGTVGGIDRPALWGAAGFALLACGVLAGWSVVRLLRSDPDNAADAWATYVAGLSAWAVLAMGAPLLVVIRNVGDEGPGLANSGRLLYAQWGMTILLAAGLAALVAAAAHRFLSTGRQRDVRERFTPGERPHPVSG